VSAKATNVIARAPAASVGRSAEETLGNWKEGKPCGSGPTTDTPAAAARSNTLTTSVAATTATSTPGMRGHRRLKRRTIARHVTPMAQLVQLVSPCATPCTKLMPSCTSPSPLAEKPRILGSCPTSTVSAMPFT